MDTFVCASLVILVNSALQVGDKYRTLFKTYGCLLVWYCQFDVSPVNGCILLLFVQLYFKGCSDLIKQ